MDDEKFVRRVDEILGKVLGNEQAPPKFGGNPGEPVPVVDSEDVKNVWQLTRSAGKSRAIGAGLMGQVCKPGSNIEAVGYRTGFLWMMNQIAPEDLARFTLDGQPSDSVFHAAANIAAEWMGVGIVRQGPPFDVAEFLRLCERG